MLALACGDTLPADVANYREACVKMNRDPLPRRSDDPHDGRKDVFACNVALEQLIGNFRPFPDGTLIVKEATRLDSDYPWLVATARKSADSWHWDEYTRNFEGEAFVHIVSGESVCVDCHRRVRSSDWIYTPFSAEP